MKLKFQVPSLTLSKVLNLFCDFVFLLLKDSTKLYKFQASQKLDSLLTPADTKVHKVNILSSFRQFSVQGRKQLTICSFTHFTPRTFTKQWDESRILRGKPGLFLPLRKRLLLSAEEMKE